MACDSPQPIASQNDIDPRVSIGSQSTTIEFPSYRAVVGHSDPFGIIDLRLADDLPLNLAHGTLPLADWEWLRWTRNGRSSRKKLLEADWGSPHIEAGSDRIGLRFNHKLTDQNIEVRVEMDFYMDLQFVVTYRITNSSDQVMDSPYVMLGFPGFGNQHQASLLGNSQQMMRTDAGMLRQQARRQQRREYVLIREIYAAPTRSLRSSSSPQYPMHSVIQFGQARAQLTARFWPPSSVSRAEAAHVNKREYLTSHLYLWLADLHPGGSSNFRVDYELRPHSVAVPREQQLQRPR